MDTAPNASGCFWGGTQEIFGAVSEDLLGGTGKAEDAKLQGAGIIPKLCPMERVEMEMWNKRVLRDRVRTEAIRSDEEKILLNAFLLP